MVLTSPKSAHKSMKEQFESVSSYIVDYLWDQPAIYCGTYKKYNEGSLFGAWLDLRTFDSYEEFIDVCMQLHADEEDPELMFQDYQCFPADTTNMVVDDKKDGGTSTEKSDIEKFYDTTNSAQALFNSLP